VARWIPLALVALIASFYLAQSDRVRYHFPLDDAWTHQVYARSLAGFHGFDYNPGQAEAGSTSPLWAIVSAPTHWLPGTDAMVLAVKLLGLAFAAAAVLLLGFIVRHLTGSRAVAITAAALFALEPRLYFSALSGMENTLLVALWLGALAAYLRGPLWLSGLLVSLTPLCRPEAVLLVPVWLVAALFRTTGARRAALALIVVPSAAWCLFCKLVTGHWLPNTFYAKAQLRGLGAALHAMFAILTQRGYGSSLALWAGLAALIVACVVSVVSVVGVGVEGVGGVARTPHDTRSDTPRHPPRSVLAGLVALPLAYAVGVAISRALSPDGYYWTRWEDPASLLLTAAATTGLAIAAVAGVARLRARDWATPLARGQLAAGAIAFVAVVLAIPPLLRDTFALRLKLDSDAYAVENNNEDVGHWLAENTPPTAVIGLQDAGAIRYFDDRTSLDVIGLNDHRIVFGEMSAAQYLASIDWFVGYPLLVKQLNFESHLDLVQSFSVPYERYTICPCPTQVEMRIYRKAR
jgi:hypothetical protein